MKELTTRTRWQFVPVLARREPFRTGLVRSLAKLEGNVIGRLAGLPRAS